MENLFKTENKNNYGNTKPKAPEQPKSKIVTEAENSKKAQQKEPKAEPQDEDLGNFSKLMAAMERTAKKEYENQQEEMKKAKKEAPKQEEELTEDEGEAIAKNMLDDFLEEQKPKPAVPAKKAKQVKKKVAVHKKTAQKYDSKVKTKQKQILAQKLSKAKKAEKKPVQEFQNENPESNQFALITQLAQKINVKVTPAILELQGADKVE